MLDLNKSLEFFSPNTVTEKVHIIGCGAVGSHVAELLARLGIQKFVLWDDDTVSTHNIVNQNFVQADIYQPKVLIVADRIKAINPEATVTVKQQRWEPKGMMSGYVFMCVDSVVPRQLMADFAQTQPIRCIFDMRMGLTSGQYYVVPHEKLETYKLTLDFTDEDADKYTPKSACNYTLSVAFSIWALVAYCVASAVDYWSGQPAALTNIVDMLGGVTRV